MNWTSALTVNDSSNHHMRLLQAEAPGRALSVEKANRPYFDDNHSGFVFILFGACSGDSSGGYDCLHLKELREAITSLRRIYPPGEVGRGVAILSDGAVPGEWLYAHLQPDLVQQVVLSSNVLDSDLRAKKLLAYGQSPYARTVFLDADTLVLSREAEQLFGALDRFDLAAAFECCRVYWSASLTPYDAAGFFKGWELQAGVMAYRHSPRVSKFWSRALELFLEQPDYWHGRSSGEQGALTLALAETDVRFIPLPPSFNARPFTLYQWLEAFGVSVYHGKEMWRHADAAGNPASVHTLIREKLMHDWSGALKLLERSLAEPAADSSPQPGSMARKSARRFAGGVGRFAEL